VAFVVFRDDVGAFDKHGEFYRTLCYLYNGGTGTQTTFGFVASFDGTTEKSYDIVDLSLLIIYLYLSLCQTRIDSL